MLVGLLEDEPIWAELVGAAIAEAGWRLIWHASAEAMLAEPLLAKADVIVSDIHMADGGMDGREFVRELRGRGLATPILMLTQFADVHRAPEAFRNQADDYLVKPFDKEELIARIGSLERRGRVADYATIRVGELKISPRFRVAYWQDSLLPLSDQSFRILQCLAETPGQVISRDRLWQRCWPQWTNLGRQDQVIDAALSQLRQDTGELREAIRTRWGSGYYLDLAA